MKLLTATIGLTALLWGCGSADTSSTEPEKTGTAEASHWIALFDGTSTKGWHNYGGGPPGAGWIVADSALVLDTALAKNGNGGNLTTDEEFDNFHLKYDWKISKNGNSGVIFFVHEDTAQYGQPYETGPEMQVLDNDGHPDGKITKHRAGDLYDLIQCSTETVKPVGEWNTAEIISDSGKLEFRLNGTTVVTTTLWDDAWDKMVAESKFKSMPGFGKFKKGKISLQDHGDVVSYKNILIKKL